MAFSWPHNLEQPSLSFLKKRYNVSAEVGKGDTVSSGSGKGIEPVSFIPSSAEASILMGTLVCPPVYVSSSSSGISGRKVNISIWVAPWTVHGGIHPALQLGGFHETFSII
jgi:hypothetical protein